MKADEIREKFSADLDKAKIEVLRVPSSPNMEALSIAVNIELAAQIAQLNKQLQQVTFRGAILTQPRGGD